MATLPSNQTDLELPVTHHPVDVARALSPRRPATWVLSIITVVVAAQLVHLLLTNPNFEWNVVAQYLNSETVLQGVVMTLFLTVTAMTIGLVLGGILAVCRLSDNALLRALASSYIWFFRGTPQLVQLIFWFNIGLLVPVLSIGIPFGPTFASIESNTLVTPLLAAIVGLGLHDAAYQAEIYRAGLISVDEGQLEAAKALGMKPVRVFFRIQLPQAMRFIVPPTFNSIIALVKGTSLVSVIGGAELLFSVKEIYSQTYQTVPLLIVASIWYLFITTVLNGVQFFIERHYGRGSSRNGSSSPVARFLDRRAAERNLNRGMES
ncbi:MULTISPECIES: amino acid ABC transporter permease [unclassified Cryobacterium]|uniref:amino acid ABC transporter permease n=1 Tax=unclassified Cryobacterium TaxID=2649013 RepID=UPI00106D3398|nr:MULTISPECIES: amino acid ABC transporter permease [unclassified Cryobacterium]TFD05553.1 amino acid ABC transporter permease [Cryobacterium sp. TMT1-66-1]TFD08738.1 amino acid ABC transporter permease [Cryobacterium sp. TMT1-2-2]